jgi:hypothetical protein
MAHNRNAVVVVCVRWPKISIFSVRIDCTMWGFKYTKFRMELKEKVLIRLLYAPDDPEMLINCSWICKSVSRKLWMYERVVILLEINIRHSLLDQKDEIC